LIRRSTVETVTISLDGREVTGSVDSTILELAGQIGVEIPTLCHHPLLRSVGACRVCLVEDVKTGRLLASCVTPISEGMEILTASPRVLDARRGVLELILSDHPSACVVCSKGNECVLRSLAKDCGICDAELDPIRKWRALDEVNPFIVRDLTKCVMCGRCIRVCKDFEAIGAVEYMSRGYDSHPGTAYRTPLEGSECNFCGSCMSICPTDALAPRDRLVISSGKERAAGVCSYCGTGCHLEYERSDGRIVGSRGIAEAPMNSISLCVRGHFGQDAISSPARLTQPLVRNEDHGFASATWEEVLDQVANRLTEISDEHGPSSIGIMAGTQCSNEGLYLAGRFARSVLRTPNVDSTAALSSGWVMDGIRASLKGALPGSGLDRILEAETILLVGARPDYTHPVIARNVRRAVRGNGAALVQIDPLTTALTPFARVHLTTPVNEFPLLMLQLVKGLVADGRHDESFLLRRVSRAEEFISRLRMEASRHAVPELVEEALKLLGKDKKVVILFGSAAARATNAYLLTRLVMDLALLCGQPESAVFLFEGCNELGAWEMGCSPDFLPGRLSWDNKEARERLRNVWGHDPVPQRGLNAMGMIRAAEAGDLKALLLLGADPLAVFPDRSRTHKALERIELLVRMDMFPANEDELADFVLPMTSITEADGTYTSTEGRVQRVSKLSEPPGEARPNARFLLDLAGRLGPPMGHLTARDIFDEIRTVCASWSRLTWADVGQPGGVPLQRVGDPASNEGTTGDEVQFVPYPPPDSYSAALEAPDGFPWRIYPEEQAAHPCDGTMSARSSCLRAFYRGDFARMNPADAEELGIADGSLVLLRSEVGEVKARLMVDPAVPLSGVIIPAGGPAYMLQRLAAWPEQYFPCGWHRVFVSLTPAEE
jgi:formate dehydrogenase alpha subunit